MISKKMPFWLMMLLFTTVFQSLHAQLVTVTPTEYPNALTNPLMGFRQDLSNAGDQTYKYTAVVRQYIKWNEIENNSTDGVQKIIDFCNQKWANLPSLNVKVIPRVYVDWDSKSGNEFWPADILTSTGLAANDPNLWKTQIVRDRIVKLIAKLGQAWNHDPRVAWIQTGIVGYWGEQENPVGVSANVVAPDNSNYVKIMGPAFKAAFPNKTLCVRNHQYWTAEGFTEMGIYWDSFAHTGQYSGAWSQIKTANNLTPPRYLKAPIEGEVAYDWGDGRSNYSDPKPGSLPNDSWDVNSTHRIPEHYNFVINTIKQLHNSALGWIASYTPGPDTETGTNLIQKAFGYRFLITEFKCSARTEPGDTLTMSAKVKNIGSSVYYENWPVAFVLVNESTRQIVHQSVINGTGTRTWRPGSNYDWDPISKPNGSKVYLTPAVDNLINAAITIPSSIAPGQYLAGITILDPSTQKPGVFFAIPNFFKESQTQPLCRIGIGADATNNLLTGVLFNNLVTDDARYYSMTPVGPTYSLTTNPSTGGSISPANGNFAQNSTIIVTAIPNSGYKFDSWGGDLSGSTNPAALVMNANKTLSASFSIAPPETVPWVENFDGLSNGTTQHGYPATWAVTPAAGFSVQNNEMAFNNVGIDGVFTTGPIDISSGPVQVSLSVRGGNGLDVGQDFLRLYKKVDGGAEVLIDAADGPQVAETWTGTIAAGKSLVLIIRAHVTASSEYYYFDDIRVTNSSSTSSPERMFVIKDNSTGKKLSVYPNPVSKKLFIKSDNSSKMSNIEIFNLNGRLLYSVKSRNSITEIDTKAISSKGIVMVKVSSECGVSFSKVVIY